MEAIVLKGTVHSLEETKEKNNYKSRKLIFTVDNDQKYTQNFTLEGGLEMCDKMDDLVPGTSASIYVNLNGRLWNNDQGIEVAFNSLRIWKFTIDISAPY